jgi:predicted HicB family RNase H-like nuclease
MQRRPEPSLKLQVYLPASLRHEIEAAAEVAGQTLSTWVERALASHIKSTNVGSRSGTTW